MKSEPGRQLPKRATGPAYSFDRYWKELVDRVYKNEETLTGMERLFFRLSVIRGERACTRAGRNIATS